jgi:hypothetical protein
MNRGPSIDFPELVSGYNRIYQTEFKNEKQMYERLYPGISPARIAKQIGVSSFTVRRRMDILGIERSHTQGGPNRLDAPKREAFLAIPQKRMAGMTFDEISKTAGISNGYTSVLTRRFNRAYKVKARQTIWDTMEG